ncbi:MAG: O-methyltransferase [Acidimicrobiales bacterium]
MTQERWDAVDGYLVEMLAAGDPVLDAALADSAAAGLPPINVTATQGKLLALLATLAGARSILEIGTLGAYSTIWMARALPAGGRLTTLEVEPGHAQVARANLARAGLADRVEVRVGAALDSLAALEAEAAGPFDMAFIDADKASNAAYFDRAVRLSRPGALIVVDNVVRGGAVVDPASDSADVVGTRRLFEALRADSRVDATAVQTVGAKGWDGFVLAVVKAQAPAA